MKTVYGYVRVSTREQKEDRQIAAMRDNGVLEENIFIDKQSGKDFNRAFVKGIEQSVPFIKYYIKCEERFTVLFDTYAIIFLGDKNKKRGSRND